MSDPLGRPGIKYYYDAIVMSECEPLGELDMHDLEEAGKRGYRVVGIHTDGEGNSCFVIEMAYTEGEPQGNWREQPIISPHGGQPEDDHA